MGRIKKNKISVPEQILELGDFLKKSKTAEEIKKELKDAFGHNIGITEIRKSLLRLLRRKKIRREGDGKMYRYFLD